MLGRNVRVLLRGVTVRISVVWPANQRITRFPPLPFPAFARFSRVRILFSVRPVSTLVILLKDYR